MADVTDAKILKLVELMKDDIAYWVLRREVEPEGCRKDTMDGIIQKRARAIVDVLGPV